MSISDKFKAASSLWIIKAFSNKKYWARRWILVKFAKNYLNKHAFEGGDRMEEGKKWYKSKSVLTAIVTVIVGAIHPISAALGHPIVVPQWVIEVLIGIGIYSVRDAVGKNSQLK